MPTQDFANIGEVLDFQILKGTITEIDSATDTCTVTVAGSSLTALIFYHCNPDSIELENGAIEGAAAGFATDDEVIVILNPSSGVTKVIGHTDGIRKCGDALIYFFGGPSDSLCFVWDVGSGQFSTKIPLNRENESDPIAYAEFPCSREDISDWEETVIAPTITGALFQESTTGSTTYPPIGPIDYYTTGVTHGDEPAKVGDGTNNYDVEINNGGEEGSYWRTTSIVISVTDSWGDAGTIDLWPPGMSRQYLVDNYFPNGGDEHNMLTSYLSDYHKENVYASASIDDASAVDYVWTTPWGDEFSVSFDSEAHFDGWTWTLVRMCHIPNAEFTSDAYKRYRCVNSFITKYSKTVLMYIIISMFKIAEETGMYREEISYTVHRNIFAGYKQCADSSLEDPMSITRNAALEAAILDTIEQQAALINLSGIPEREGPQLTDRVWSCLIVGGANS